MSKRKSKEILILIVSSIFLIILVSVGTIIGNLITSAFAAENIQPPATDEDYVPIYIVAAEPNLVSLGEFELTAYCPCVKCCGIWSAEHPSRIGTDFEQRTKSGTIPTAGRTVAVDPEIIPLGSTLYFFGQYWTTEDTGSAVRENIIDIFMLCHNEALQFGRQRAEVFLKNGSQQ